MIFGNPKEIAVTYEVLARQPDSHFAFGTFNIFIGDKLLLSGGSDWTIDCLVGYLRKTKDLTAADSPSTPKETLFKRACSTRGYLLHDSPRIKSEWWKSEDPLIVKKVEAYLAEIESMRADPPFGLELPLYAELVDQGVRIFLFASENSERIVYSCDRGQTVTEKLVARGTINAFIASLPKAI
jgi:hypothetical protein